MVSRTKDITGIKFGSLTAIKLAYVKNRQQDDLATLEFLPDFDTRYTYLLSLSLGIDA